MVKTGFLSDDIPGAVKFKADKWHRYRSNGLSTFNFSVSKSDPRYQNIKLEEASYFSFVYKGRSYLFTIIGVKDSSVTTHIQFETVDNNADIVYEEAPSIDNKDSHDIIWYLERSGLTGNSQLKIGINELAGVKRTLKYDSTNDTKITRLQDIMASFDAEFEFETVLSYDGPIQETLIHIYREHDDRYQGVGRRRDDLPPLMSETGLEVVERDIDYKGIWTAVKVTGKDNLNFTNQSAKIYNTDGQVEFEKVAGDQYYRAVLAARLFPSNAKQAGVEIATYREKTLTTDYTKQDQLMNHGLKFLQANAYPKITFSAKARSSLVRNQRFDLDLGDTWKMQTDKLRNDDGSQLLLEFRVDEIEMSFTEPNVDQLTFSNFKKLKSHISDDLQAMVDKLVADRLPYTLDLATDNGTVFKNGTGNSLITPILKRGTERISGASFVWTVGNDTQTAQTYSIAAENVNGTQLVSVEAIVDGQSVAKSEITFTDVTDGKTGAGIKSVKTLNKLSATNTANKDGTFAETKPNPTKAEPYVVSYTKTELTDGTTIETPATVTEVRNPEFDDLGKKITDVKSQVDDAKQDHDRQVAEIRAQATDAASLASQAQQIGNQAKADAANAYRTAAQAKTDAIEEATRLNTALAGRVDTVEKTANGTKTTVSNLSKTVNEQGQSISTLTTKTNEVRTLADGTKRTVDSLSTTVGTHGTSIDNINKKTKTIEDGLSGITEKYENLQVGIRNILKGTRDLSGNNSKNFNTSDKYGDFNIARSRPTSGYNDTFTATTEPLTNTEYIISFFAKSDVNNATCVCHFYSPNTTTYVETSTGYIKDIKPDGYAVVKLSTEWKRYWVKYKQTVSTPPSAKQVIIGRNNTADGIKSIEIAGVAMYEGHATKEYFDAPEDSKAVLDNITHEVAEYKRTNDEALTSLRKTVTDETKRIDDVSSSFQQTVKGFETKIIETQGMIPTGINQNLFDFDLKKATLSPSNQKIEEISDGWIEITIAKAWSGFSWRVPDYIDINKKQYTVSYEAYLVDTIAQKGRLESDFGIPDQLTEINKEPKRYVVVLNKPSMFVGYLNFKVNLSEVGKKWRIRNIKLEEGVEATPYIPTFATTTKFNVIEETVNEHKQTIGDGTAISQAIQSAGKYERSIAIGGDLYQAIETAKGLLQEVSGKDGLKTQMTQLQNSWAIKYLTDAGTILSQINLNKDGTVKIDGKLVQITDGTYIKDGVITADKLDVKKLSAIISDLGEITGGTITLSKHHPEDVGYVFVKNAEKGNVTYDIAQVEPYTIPAHDTDMLITDNNIIINGPLMKLSKTSPVDSHIVTILRSKGLHFRMDSGTINREKRDIGIDIYGMLIDGDLDLKIESSGNVEINAKNYSTYLNPSKNIKVVRQGGTMSVWFDVTSNTTGNYYIGNLPKGFRPASGSQELVAEWDTGALKRIQVDAQGNLTILGANKGKRYCTTLTLIC